VVVASADVGIPVATGFAVVLLYKLITLAVAGVGVWPALAAASLIIIGSLVIACLLPGILGRTRLNDHKVRNLEGRQGSKCTKPSLHRSRHGR
jgi:hypothetical protein